MVDGKLASHSDCCCECKPCPYCDAACLSVTFDGWDCTGVGLEGLCNLSSSSDINGTFLLTRGRRRKVPVIVVTSTGSGAIIWAVLGWDNEAATHYIAGVDIEDGGVDYAEGDTAIVDGNTFPREEICGKTPHVEITVEDGVIVSAEVTDPGEIVLARERGEDDPNIYPRWSCIYSRCDFIECESGVMLCRYITLEVTAAQRTLTVTFGDPFSYGLQAVLLRGELAADETPCDGLEFTADDFVTESILHPCAVGTAVVEPADCDGPPPEACCALGTCCIPLCCVFMGVVIWAPNDPIVDPEPPGGWIIPDAVPGYTYEENGPLGSGWYRNYCPDVECDQSLLIADFESAVQSVDPYAGTDYAAVVYPIGQGSAYSDGTEEGHYCSSGPDGLGYAQATCEELRGTWYDTSTDPDACLRDCGQIACCLPDGTCQDMYSGECAAAGGVRPGNGLTCFEGTCDNVFP